MDTNLYEQRTRVQYQQTNTFLKGMDTDTSDMLLGTDQYRYAQNVRITTDKDGANGELHTIEGTQQLKNFGQNVEVLSFSSIRDICVAILYDTSGVNWKWSIIKWTNNDADHATTVFGPSSEPLWDTGLNPECPRNTPKHISTVLRYESKKNIKLYIADYKHEMVSLNIATPKYVVDNDNPQCPYTSDNVYEAAFTYKESYLPKLETEISASQSGTIKAGTVLYTYRLYIENGSASDLAPFSTPIRIYKDNYSGYSGEETSNKSVFLTLNDLSASDEDVYIQVFRINYIQNGQLPAVDLIIDTPLTNQSMQMRDYGQTVESISSAELLSYISQKICPKILESKGDILFAANVKDIAKSLSDEFNAFDARSYSAGNYKDTDTPVLSLGEGDTWTNTTISDIDLSNLKHSQFNGYEGSIHEFNYDNWKAITPSTDLFGETTYNGIGNNIWWKYVYDVPAVYAGSTGITRVTPASEASVLMEDSNSDPKYRAGEVYRFGIRMFDQDGKASPIKWIADIQIPDYHPITYNSDTIRIPIHVSDIKFFVKIPESLNCSGYEIVRCDRTIDDRYTLFTGISGVTYYNEYGDDNQIDYRYNPGFFTQDKVNIDPSYYLHLSTGDYLKQVIGYVGNKASQYQDNKLIMFTCPEYCYQKDDVQQIINNYKSTIRFTNIDRIQNRASTFGNYGNLLLSKQGPSGAYGSSSIVTSDIVINNSNTSSTTFNTCYNEGSGTGIGFIPEIADNNISLNVNAGLMYLQDNTDQILNNQTDITLPRPLPDDSGRLNSIYLNYFQQLYQYYATGIITKQDYVISDNIKYPQAPDYNEFIDDDGNFKYIDNVTSTDNKNFINWSLCVLTRRNIYTNGTDDKHDLLEAWKVINDGFDDPLYGYSATAGENDPWRNFASSNQGPRYAFGWYPIGAGDDMMLIPVKKENDPTSGVDIQYLQNDTQIPHTYISSIRKPATPYGGYNKNSITQSSYYSTGDYVNLNIVTASNDVKKTSILSKGGDTFYTDFIYTAAHWWYNPIYNQYLKKMCTVYKVRIPSDIDIKGQSGYLFRVGRGTETNEYKIQNKAVSQLQGYTQDRNQYMYNTAYSVHPNLVPYTQDTTTKAETNTYDTRVYYSQNKTNNERIDNWSIFKSNDFLDVDTRFGEITDLKLFKDKLMFWQVSATGILSANDRTLLNTVDDAQIMLGSGDVLQRFDYITQIYGQKPNQYTSCPTNTNLYWWDEVRREILQYTDGYSVTPIGTAKTIRNYLNKYDPNSCPTVIYDVDNHEVICSVVNNESIVYNDLVQQFTAVYKFCPLFHTMCYQNLYMIGARQLQVGEPLQTYTAHLLYKYGTYTDGNMVLFDTPVYPSVKFVVNKEPAMNKTFDIQTFGGKFYGGGSSVDETASSPYKGDKYSRSTTPLAHLTFSYSTPLKQSASISGGDAITNVEYDYKLVIPRNGENAVSNPFNKQQQWGNRLRGKIMQVEMSSNSNSSDFSLHYITTKYRMSWT